MAKVRLTRREVAIFDPDEDVVRGQVAFKASEMSDFIIQKSDGFPTYHFACVVDDELMQVTHVIRGQEHLMNTPLHLALQQALGFRTPTYAHMSVTVSAGGGKLSKRERAKTLLKAIKKLPEKTRLAITLYYYEKLTFKEIGKILNVSESRISQIHSETMAKLKKEINKMIYA